jgi:hypothetical protein
VRRNKARMNEKEVKRDKSKEQKVMQQDGWEKTREKLDIER